MVIRCERCSTMYELDESLLAPTGSEVQCTKCQHVFTAFPPGSAGRTLVGVPAQPAPAAPASHPPAAASAPAAGAPVAPPEAPAPASSRADGAPAAPRPVKTSTPAIYRPQVTAGAGAASSQLPRAPVLKRDTVGTFEARLRWSNRVRWLVPLAGVLVVAAIAAIWALVGRRGDAGAERARAEAVALLALDDGASVEQAASRLGAVVTGRPKLRAAAADRALALVLRAAASAEDAEGLAARVAELRDERERARREQGPGWQEVERTSSAETNRLEPELRAREEKTRALTSGARDQLGVLQSEAGETPGVVRALAMLHALTGERDRLRKVIRSARDHGLRDAWLDLADGWGDARDPDRAARERALVKLGALAAARPDLLRGRYLLARAQLSLGRKAEALATAEGVLAANPNHEGAKRVRGEVQVKPAPQSPAAPAAQAEAPATASGSPPVPAPAAAPGETPVPRRRKSLAQPVPAPSPESPAAEPAPEQPAPAPQPEVAPAPVSASPPPEAAPAPPAPPAPPPETAPAPPPPQRRLILPEPASDGG